MPGMTRKMLGILILVAVLVCVSIAVGFGVYPAISAARMNPVLALQSD